MIEFDINEINRIDIPPINDDVRKIEKKFTLKDLLYCTYCTIIVMVGFLNMVGYIIGSQEMRAIAFVTAASPLPLVFSSYNGIETFSTTFTINATLDDGTRKIMELDHELYSKIEGPYNRRNIFGAVFSHGPFFRKEKVIERREKLIALREKTLDYAICQNGIGIDLGDNYVRYARIHIRSKTAGSENISWTMDIMCQN